MQILTTLSTQATLCYVIYLVFMTLLEARLPLNLIFANRSESSVQSAYYYNGL